MALPDTQFDREHPDVAFLQESRDRLLQPDQVQLAEHEKGPYHRVTGERNFMGRREDTDLDRGSRIRGREHKHGLGQVHLPSNLLELSVGQTNCVRHHSYRIPAKRLRGEYVSLIEFERTPFGTHDRRTVQ